MSDHIPFEIQSEIMKRLPVKSLIQFRSVSKQWKSFIDSPEFINNYHINHTNLQHHLLVSYKLDTVQTYTSIIDNNTFPQQKFPLTAPKSFSLLRNPITLSSVDGLLCLCGSYGDVFSKSQMAIIWNPSIRKSVGIVIPIPKAGSTVVGFGVGPDTSDPKLVKISVDKISSIWMVEVFTLSTRVWETVYMGAPYKSCDFLMWFQSEKFGEVCLPERLVHTPLLEVTKVNESLGLLEYYVEGEMSVCGVWTRKDGANKPFTKIYTVKVEGKVVFDRVLGFRNNGEVVMEMDNDNYEDSGIEVYEPLSGHISGILINGNQGTFFARSYMETLLLLDQSDSVIY